MSRETLDRRRNMLKPRANVVAALSVVLGLSISVSSCEKRIFLAKGEVVGGTERPAQTEIRRSLIGAWTSDAHETQFGQATLTICFSSDGNFKTTAKTQAGPIENHGSYRTSGDTVTFTSLEGVTVVAKVRLQGDRLVVTEPEKQAMSYRRAAPSC